MFTGLIQEIGRIQQLHQHSAGARISIDCQHVIQHAHIGDSIAVNGVCLTATTVTSHSFTADISIESLRRSCFSVAKVGQMVNLEKSLTLQDPLGGHLVTGDIECRGRITGITHEGFSRIYTIAIDTEWLHYVVLKGRIAIDGASLTVMQIDQHGFSVMLIPHSQHNIILGKAKVGDLVNIETDMLAKMVAKQLPMNNTPKTSRITKQFLDEYF